MCSGILTIHVWLGRRPEGNEPQMQEACVYDSSISGFKGVNIRNSTPHLRPITSKARNITRSITPCQRVGGRPPAVAAGMRGFALPAGVLVFKALGPTYGGRALRNLLFMSEVCDMRLQKRNARRLDSAHYGQGCEIEGLELGLVQAAWVGYCPLPVKVCDVVDVKGWKILLSTVRWG